MLEPNNFKALLSDFSLDEVQCLVDENPNLRGYLQGYLAEHKLKSLLEATPGVGSVEKIPDSSPIHGDFLVEYGGNLLYVEAKSFRYRSSRFDHLTQSWEGTVECKNPGSRLLRSPGGKPFRATCVEEGRFDVLAVCTQPVTGSWSFVFAPEPFLPRAENKPGFLQGKFKVDPLLSPGFYSDPIKAFDLALSLKIQG